ncbi:MAG: hypothetical protein JWO38_703 [Gemmataceae bacterium]|nr:hypothetical protein [Gemmataceae bacterium]
MSTQSGGHATQTNATAVSGSCMRYAANRWKQSTEATSYAFEMAAQLPKRVELFDRLKPPPRDLDRSGTHDLGRDPGRGSSDECE